MTKRARTRQTYPLDGEMPLFWKISAEKVTSISYDGIKLTLGMISA